MINDPCHLAWLSGFVLEPCVFDQGVSYLYVMDLYLDITIEFLNGIL